MPATFAGQFRTVIRNNRLQKKAHCLTVRLEDRIPHVIF